MRKANESFPELEQLVEAMRASIPLERSADVLELASRVPADKPMDEASLAEWADGIAVTVAKIND